MESHKCQPWRRKDSDMLKIMWDTFMSRYPFFYIISLNIYRLQCIIEKFGWLQFLAMISNFHGVHTNLNSKWRSLLSTSSIRVENHRLSWNIVNKDVMKVNSEYNMHGKLQIFTSICREFWEIFLSKYMPWWELSL